MNRWCWLPTRPTDTANSRLVGTDWGLALTLAAFCWSEWNQSKARAKPKQTVIKTSKCGFVVSKAPVGCDPFAFRFGCCFCCLSRSDVRIQGDGLLPDKLSHKTMTKVLFSQLPLSEQGGEGGKAFALCLCSRALTALVCAHSDTGSAVGHDTTSPVQDTVQL